MMLNTAGKTDNNNPIFAMMKSIVLPFLLFIGVNTHSALAKDTPNKTTVGHEKNTIGNSDIKVLQDLLAPLKSENLNNIEFVFLPSVRFMEFPSNDESIVFDSVGSDEIPLEERSDFLFSVPKKENMAVWEKIQELMFTDIMDNHSINNDFIDHNYFISVRLIFDNHILYVSNYRFNKENISIRRGDTRIVLNTHAMRDFVSIFDRYIEHPILKKSLYKHL